MSAQTRADLEAAIQAHVLDEYAEPRLVTDYAVLIANQGTDDSTTGYFYACPPGMAAHVLTGLVGHFLRSFQHGHSIEEEGQ